MGIIKKIKPINQLYVKVCRHGFNQVGESDDV